MESYDKFSSFYDMFTDDVDYLKMADFFNGIMEPHSGKDKILLDLCCGTGSLSVILAKMGYDVIGVDKSPMMLAEAQKKSLEAGTSILFLNQDMTRLDLFGTINCCVCALDSLNHLKNIKEVKRTMERVALFLEQDGVFVFDLNTPYKHKNILSDNSFIFEKDNVFCGWQNETLGLKTYITLDFFEKQGRNYERYTEEFCETAYEIDDIKEILHDSGFKLLEIYNEEYKKAVHYSCERLIFVAVKE